MDLLFMLFATVVALVFVGAGTMRSEAKVSERLRADGLEPVTVKMSWTKGTRHRRHLDFVALTNTGQRVTGHAERAAGQTTLFYDDGFDRLGYLRDRLANVAELEPALLGDPEANLETRILFETNQRLERLQGDREAFLAHDLNADGVIDAEEWDLVRERVRAEVRAELTGVAPPEPIVAAAEPAAELVDEPAQVETDGHW